LGRVSRLTTNSEPTRAVGAKGDAGERAERELEDFGADMVEEEEGRGLAVYSVGLGRRDVRRWEMGTW
jgi:hypothetical protein